MIRTEDFYFSCVDLTAHDLAESAARVRGENLTDVERIENGAHAMALKSAPEIVKGLPRLTREAVALAALYCYGLEKYEDGGSDGGEIFPTRRIRHGALYVCARRYIDGIYMAGTDGAQFAATPAKRAEVLRAFRVCAPAATSVIYEAEAHSAARRYAAQLCEGIDVAAEEYRPKAIEPKREVLAALEAVAKAGAEELEKKAGEAPHGQTRGI